MKILTFISLFLVQPLFGQISVSPFYSLAFEKQESNIKERIGSGFGLSYNLNKAVGIGLQVRDRELWRLNSKIEELVALKTFTGQFYVHGTNKKESAWLFFPVAGVLGGIVTRVDPERPGEDSNDFLSTPIVFGVFSGAHFGRNLLKNFYAGIFFKIEGDIGILRDRKMPNENVSTAGFLSVGFSLNYNFRE